MAILGLFVLLFNRCLDEPAAAPDPRGPDYAGSAKCITCHREIYTSYAQTAHALTSSPASTNTIKGSFAAGSNAFYYRPELKVVMEATDSGFYQAAYLDDVRKIAARFDIVTGSGRKGQSYLYWYNDNIFQLPVSYNVAGKSWINSPNFPPHNVQFTRSIPVGCFECHSSYIKITGSEPAGDFLVDHFARNSIIYGIDCERCHGAAAQHADFQETHPLEKTGKYITSIASLDRDAQLGACAVCHSGAAQTRKSGFEFKPGGRLSDYLYADTSSAVHEIDVHGKQYQSLKASKCFRQSSMLTCNSCHNTHIKERDLSVFSAKCMNCHNAASHPALKTADTSINTMVSNCIDCHMPANPSKLITMQAAGAAVAEPAVVRSHYISIYPEKDKQAGVEK